MATNEFRTRLLTLLGAIGYLVAIALLVIDVLPTFTVSLQSVFIILATSSALLGVDFGLDVFSSRGAERPYKPRDTQPIERADNDRQRK